KRRSVRVAARRAFRLRERAARQANDAACGEPVAIARALADEIIAGLTLVFGRAGAVAVIGIAERRGAAHVTWHRAMRRIAREAEVRRLCLGSAVGDRSAGSVRRSVDVRRMKLARVELEQTRRRQERDGQRVAERAEEPQTERW